MTTLQIQELIENIQNFLKNSELSQLLQDKTEIEQKLEDPLVWKNQSQTTDLNKELSKTDKKIRQLQNLASLCENLQIALELNEETLLQNLIIESQNELEKLQNEKFLNGKFDQNAAILSVHAGAGGIDAQDWAAMLASMYQAFAKNIGYDCTIIDLSSGEEGGIKSISLKIEGENAYGFLKEEIGTHRLVRISPFNAGKTRETSFALVEVLPDGLESEINLQIEDKDLRWDYFMSSGKGGQSVNTTYSAVRVVHLPTGLSVSCQNQRSQQQNKQEALKYLKNKLAAIELQKQQEFKNELKGDFKSAEWGSQIRSYVLHPYKLVKDNRSNWETSNVNEILEEGKILDLIWSVKKAKFQKID